LKQHSVSAGLDYPGVGPEHAYLKEVFKTFQPAQKFRYPNSDLQLLLFKPS
jgi:hypothetical protein